MKGPDMTGTRSSTSRGTAADDVQRGVIEHRQLLIGGQWRDPHASDLIQVFSANTEKLIGSVAGPDSVDIDAAVRAARAAFDDRSGWPSWAPTIRAQAMHRLADAIDRRSAEIARQVSDQNGVPISVTMASEGRIPGQLLRQYADLAAGQTGEEVRASSASGRTLVRRVPVGVVAGIVPWNVPNVLAALRYAPALAAGCTVVLKPAPETPLDAILLGEAVLEADLPPGVINIVPGGRDAGANLVAHPGVDMVAFTGSTAIARQIGEVCGRMLRPVTLEGGGKSAAIVLDDADLNPSNVGQALAPALFGMNGQACHISSRVLAPRSRYDEVIETIVGLARSLQVGDSLDPATQVGPLVSERQRRRVEGYIANGVEQGARLIEGGGRPAHRKTGWFVEPTVFADVDNSLTIAREEIFGPVVTITPYTDDNDAIRIANDSEYGLAGTVWTTNGARGIDVARRIVSGSVGINHYTYDMNSPTTMIKASGLGVKLGPEALGSYHRNQSVYL
jgi:acyl-CoA reductase-like NAD-dependent aldehyde dehydrogenase